MIDHHTAVVREQHFSLAHTRTAVSRQRIDPIPP
jgi:hypothetical protein